VYIYLV